MVAADVLWVRGLDARAIGKYERGFIGGANMGDEGELTGPMPLDEGLSLGLVLSVPKQPVPGRRVIVQLGALDATVLTVAVGDDDEVSFSVRDLSGREHEVRAPIADRRGRPFYLLCELVPLGPKEWSLRIAINNLARSASTAHAVLGSHLAPRKAFGSDLKDSNGALFTHWTILLKELLTEPMRSEFADYVKLKYSLED